MKTYKIGYTQGTFDMLHRGHINEINNAKAQCDTLIVGVNSDRLVQEYKGKIPVVNEEDRKFLVENLKAVDQCMIADTLDKEVILEETPFDAVFIGDDWKESARWKATERVLAERGIDVVYLPHTDGYSSTNLRKVEGDRVDE